MGVFHSDVNALLLRHKQVLREALLKVSVQVVPDNWFWMKDELRDIERIDEVAMQQIVTLHEVCHTEDELSKVSYPLLKKLHDELDKLLQQGLQKKEVQQKEADDIRTVLVNLKALIISKEPAGSDELWLGEVQKKIQANGELAGDKEISFRLESHTTIKPLFEKYNIYAGKFECLTKFNLKNIQKSRSWLLKKEKHPSGGIFKEVGTNMAQAWNVEIGGRIGMGANAANEYYQELLSTYSTFLRHYQDSGLAMEKLRKHVLFCLFLAEGGGDIGYDSIVRQSDGSWNSSYQFGEENQKISTYDILSKREKEDFYKEYQFLNEGQLLNVILLYLPGEYLVSRFKMTDLPRSYDELRQVILAYAAHVKKEWNIDFFEINSVSNAQMKYSSDGLLELNSLFTYGKTFFGIATHPPINKFFIDDTERDSFFRVLKDPDFAKQDVKKTIMILSIAVRNIIKILVEARLPRERVDSRFDALHQYDLLYLLNSSMITNISQITGDLSFITDIEDHADNYWGYMPSILGSKDSIKRGILGIVTLINNHAFEDMVIQEMFEATKNQPELRVPIYDVYGKLIWPKKK